MRYSPFKLHYNGPCQHRRVISLDEAKGNLVWLLSKEMVGCNLATAEDNLVLNVNTKMTKDVREHLELKPMEFVRWAMSAGYPEDWGICEGLPDEMLRSIVHRAKMTEARMVGVDNVVFVNFKEKRVIRNETQRSQLLHP